MGEDEVLIKVFQQPVPVLLRQRRRAQDGRAHAGFRCATVGSSCRLRSTIVTIETRTKSTAYAIDRPIDAPTPPAEGIRIEPAAIPTNSAMAQAPASVTGRPRAARYCERIVVTARSTMPGRRKRSMGTAGVKAAPKAKPIKGEARAAAAPQRTTMSAAVVRVLRNSIDHRRSLSDTSLGNSTRATDEGSTIRTSAICAALEYCPKSAEPVNRSSRKTFVRRRRKPSSVTR